ncbi:GlsB/YeaQ/YmgE family stress response membrane protein [Tahibacter amnicola]|uniref:GlsB/YeaQ/YmgE family stress response membrane protein n=1 Tax=Tahibacter amnicola TaxID=2976241 RepID=A0ABY6BH51_9GAMM|nr:GlsB/YeaQ/YmgE family stress response membrane protein [Tahibacter amnicola]UXI68405.1 GlsB/YeaQ/YmgE family stress response membrane protein [Tahibacter amnicola]
MPVEALLITVLVGIASGWLVTRYRRGRGFGLLGNIVAGILGAFAGGYGLRRLGLGIADSLAGAGAEAAIGALLVAVLAGLVKRPTRPLS